MKIKSGDTVIVISGKDKGRVGKVMKVASKNLVLVEGVALVKKHVRPDPNKNQQGGIQDRESLINVSNIAIYNPITKKADRISFKFLEDGRKVRCFKSNMKMIDI